MADNRFASPADPYEEEGLPGTDNALPGKQITGDPQDDLPVPGDVPTAVTDYGTTASEQSNGEPLSLRVTREQPDVGEADSAESTGAAGGTAGAGGDRAADESANPYPEDADERAGRLVQPDQGSRDDTEPSEVAQSVGTDAGGFSAEERAVHVVPGDGS